MTDGIVNLALRRAVAEEMSQWPVAWPNSRRDVASTDTVRVYAEAVDGCTLALIPEAGRRLRRTSKFFPSAAEFAEAMDAVAVEARKRELEETAALRRQAAQHHGVGRCGQCGGKYSWRTLLDSETLEPMGWRLENGDWLPCERYLCDCQWEHYEARYDKRRIAMTREKSRAAQERELQGI